jgi:hypothetical protein
MRRSLIVGLALGLVLAPPPVGAARLSLEWRGGATDRNPGTWTIRLTDAEPGARGSYSIDGGAPVAFGAGDTEVPVPGALGSHVIDVAGPGNLVLRDARTIVDDDTTPPRLTVEYAGDGTLRRPGVWIITLADPESPHASGSYRINDGAAHALAAGTTVVAVPYYEGTYTIEVTATNNDRDLPGDEDVVTVTDTREVR